MAGEQTVISEDIDAAIKRLYEGLEPRLKGIIEKKGNFKLIINATQENKRRYRFKAEVIEIVDID